MILWLGSRRSVGDESEMIVVPTHIHAVMKSDPQPHIVRLQGCS